VASPKTCQPPAEFLNLLDTDRVTITEDPIEAVRGADAINTDVWLSMGQEDQKEKEAEFAGFQVNSGLLAGAAEGHIVLHCLPAYRGKEISEEVLEGHADVIFQQAENRLHAQKAILVELARA
jgi:ornithine carbamoyltransferase